MSKRINYGKTFGAFYDFYRKFYKELISQGMAGNEIPQAFFDYFVNNFAKSLDDVTALNLFLKDMKHEILHIYLKDAELLSFLENIEIRDLEGLKKYLTNNGEIVQVNTNNTIDDTTPGISFGICLHPPFVKQGYVILYTLLIKTNELRIFINNGAEQFHISSNEIENKKSIIYTNHEFNSVAKLAVNLISYICCFPECVLDGAPRDIKTENNKYLYTSDKVLEAQEKVTSGIINPHFRRGYFKHLSSDFYKNKKGQIIFVHETMVNSTAKTVID